MSTIRVNTLQNTSTTDGGISINNSGHVTVDGVAMPSAGPLSNRNLIINGAMQVAQRGTSSTADGYIVDRFATYSGGGVSITQSQEVLTSGGPYDEGFRYFLRSTNTSATANTNSYSQIQQQIEAQNMAQSGWDYTNSNSFITCSFWVRSSLAGTYYVQYRNNDAGDYYFVKSLTVSADTWTKVTHTIPGEASVVFNNDNGSGLQFTLLPHYGSDFTSSSSTVDAWYTQTSTTYAPDFPQNWNNTASATFDLTGVQLEVGSVATPFEHRSYGDELRRCQRYYRRISASSDAAYARMFPLMHMATSTVARCVVPLSPTMRARPSYNQSGTFTTQPSSGSPSFSLDTSGSPEDGNSVTISASSMSGTAGNAITAYANNDASAFVEFSAEL